MGLKGGGNITLRANSTGNTTTMKILTIQLNPTGYIFNINGSPAIDVGNSSYQYPSNKTSLGDGICGPNGMYLSERIWYQGNALTTLEIQQVEGYLAKKWGLQDSLPSTHPFKY